MAEKFGQEVLTMIGFLDGINESLLIEIDLDTVEEDTVVSLAFDKERLYKNMVAAKADWLYELPQWKEIFSEEELKKFYKEQKESTTIRKPKKIGRNDPCPCGSGKNIKMLWQIIFLVTGILSLIYYSAVCIALKKWDSTFRFWLATGIVGIAGSALIRLYGMPCIVEAMIGISVCFLLIAEIKIIKGMHRKPLGKEKNTLKKTQNRIRYKMDHCTGSAGKRPEDYRFTETKTGLRVRVSERASGCTCDRLRRTGKR